MKVLTAAQMAAVDRRTIELGIPGLVLMENAGHRVVELIEEKFDPIGGQLQPAATTERSEYDRRGMSTQAGRRKDPHQFV